MYLETKQKWIDALRGGEYKQAVGALRKADGGYCCLGVLCDLHAQEAGIAWEIDDAYMGCYKSVPPEVRTWAGLPTTFGILGRTPLGDLADMNDKEVSFEEIAKVIEEYL